MKVGGVTVLTDSLTVPGDVLEMFALPPAGVRPDVQRGLPDPVLSQSAFSFQANVLQAVADPVALLQQGELPARRLSRLLRQHLQGTFTTFSLLPFNHPPPKKIKNKKNNMVGSHLQRVQAKTKDPLGLELVLAWSRCWNGWFRRGALGRKHRRVDWRLIVLRSGNELLAALVAQHWRRAPRLDCR